MKRKKYLQNMNDGEQHLSMDFENGFAHHLFELNQ